MLERVYEILGTETSRTTSISILRLRAILLTARIEPLTPAVRRKIKAAYAMLAFSTFLAPQEPYPKVSNEILYYVQYPDEMDEFDVCEYIVQGMRSGAQRVRRSLDQDEGSMVLEVCLIIPQVNANRKGGIYIYACKHFICKPCYHQGMYN